MSPEKEVLFREHVTEPLNRVFEHPDFQSDRNVIIDRIAAFKSARGGQEFSDAEILALENLPTRAMFDELKQTLDRVARDVAELKKAGRVKRKE